MSALFFSFSKTSCSCMISNRLNGWTNRHITWIFPCMSVRNEVCMYVYRALCMYANELFKVGNWPWPIKDKYKTQSNDIQGIVTWTLAMGPSLLYQSTDRIWLHSCMSNIALKIVPGSICDLRETLRSKLLILLRSRRQKTPLFNFYMDPLSTLPSKSQKG